MTDRQVEIRRLATTIALYNCGGFIKEAIEEMLIKNSSAKTFEAIREVCGIDENYFYIAEEVQKVYKKKAAYIETYCELSEGKKQEKKEAHEENILDSFEFLIEEETTDKPQENPREDYKYKDKAEKLVDWMLQKAAQFMCEDKKEGHSHFWSSWDLEDSESKCAKEINPVEERILYYYYGLDGNGRRSFLQIARMPEFKTSVETIRCIYAAGEKGYRYTVRKFERVIEEHIMKHDGKIL